MYIIAEIANAAQGVFEDNFKLVSKAQKTGANAVKFQFYKYDALSTPSYSKYEIYKETFYTAGQRSKFVKFAKSLGLDVWVDIFDEWGFEVARKNLSHIDGIKIPPTVSLNYKLVEQILDLKLPILVGVGGLDDDQIDVIVSMVKDHSEEVILMYGYQGFPTNENDTTISRIGYLKKKYGYKMGFADHVDAESDLSVKMPCYAVFAGADVIEKHITLDRRSKGYDYYSSLEVEEFKLMVKELNRCSQILGKSTKITKDQKKYLEHAVRAVINSDKKRGELILNEDIQYKRTGNLNDLLPNEVIKHLPAVAKKDIIRNSGIEEETLKKINIGIVILCRLHSTRLPKKAILKFGNMTAVQRCMKNCLKSKISKNVILATSLEKIDDDLKEEVIDGVDFFRGSPDNPAKRILNVAKKYSLDYIVRVTGDSPLVSYELLDELIVDHIHKNADYSYISNAPLGLKSEVFNVSAIQKLFDNLETDKYSEYLTLYFKNNPDLFTINAYSIDDKNILKYKDARFNLDYQDDYDMLQRLFEEIDTEHAVSLKEIFNVLEKKPDIVKINSHIVPKYFSDKKLRDTLNQVTKIR